MGLILAWVLVRYEFPGKRIMDGMIELPFALPTAVAGISLTSLTSDQGLIGSFFAKFGIKIAYTKLGITFALIFVGIPFVARAVQPVLEKLDGSYEEAARVMGAKPAYIFRRVILPEAIVVALPSLGNSFIGLIKGTSLAFVCAVVEMTAAGKIIAGRTYRYFEVYVSLAIIYWIITIIVEQGIKLIEKKIRIPENAPAIQTDEGVLNQ